MNHTPTPGQQDLARWSNAYPGSGRIYLGPVRNFEREIKIELVCDCVWFMWAHHKKEIFHHQMIGTS